MKSSFNIISQKINTIDDLIYKSRVMNKVAKQIKIMSKNRTNLIITGEYGTGKELTARIIFSKKPFIKIPIEVLCGLSSQILPNTSINNLSDITDTIDSGILFIEEITRANIQLQKKIYNFIIKNPQFNIVISSTTNLEKSGIDRNLLNTILSYKKITIPALRERNQDIRIIAEKFLHDQCVIRNISYPDISGKVWNALLKYKWPGNISELKDVCKRMILTHTPNQIIDVSSLPVEIYSGTNRTRKIHGAIKRGEYIRLLDDAVNNFEFEYISKVLDVFSGNQSHTARVLGIHRNTLLSKIKKLNIKVNKKRIIEE